MKINRIYLKNFLSLYVSTNQKEIEIDRSNSDNPIVLILGSNGSGKSSLISEITPYPLEHIEGRTRSRIIPNEIGEKQIDIAHNNFIYKCVIIYDTVKSKTTCFINEYDTLDKTNNELNPNGNVNSYIEILEQKLGLNKKFVNIGYLSDSITNFINMKSSERNSYISQILPDINDFLSYYDKCGKKINVLKKELTSINMELSKYSDLNIEVKLKMLNMNNANYKQDIRELENSIVRFDTHLGYLNEDYNFLNNDSWKDIIKNEYDNIYHTRENLLLDIDALSKLMNDPDKLKEDRLVLEKKIMIENNNLKSYKEERSRLDIKNMELSVNHVKVNKPITDDVNLDSLVKEKESLLEYLKSSNVKVTSDMDINDIISMDFKFDDINLILQTIDISGISHIKNIDDLNSYIEELNISLETNKSCKSKCDVKMQDIHSSILKIQSNNIDKSILDKRPFNCKMDCPMYNQMQLYVNKDTSEIDKEYKIANDKMIEITKNEEYLRTSLDNLIYFKRCIEKLNFVKDITLYNIPNNPIEAFHNIQNIIIYIKSLKEAVSINNRLLSIESNIKSINDNNKLVALQNKIDSQLLDVNNRLKELNELITFGEANVLSLTKEFDILSRVHENYDALVKEVEQNNKEIQKYDNKINKIIKLKYEKDCYDVLEKTKLENSIKLKDLNKELTLNENEINQFKNVEANVNYRNSRKAEIAKDLSILNDLYEIWSPKVGYPSILIKRFLTSLRNEVNEDLNKLWGASLQIEEFILNQQEFSIVVNRSGSIIEDAIECSDGERSMLALSISLSILKLNLTHRKYNILRFDELDAKLDEQRRRTFLEILQTRLTSMGIENLWIITHNNEFDNVKCDTVLLKGFSNNVDNSKNVIFRL